MDYLSPDEMKRNLEFLRSHFENEVSPAGIEEACELIFEKLGGAVPQFTGDRDGELHLCRARPATDFPNFHPVAAADLSYPPAAKTGWGRANLSGRPVFYASDMPFEAIVETDPEYEGKCFYLGVWRFSGRIAIAKFLYHPNGLGHRINELFEEAVPTIASAYTAHSALAKEHILEHYMLCSTIFLGDSWAVSSIVAHRFLNDFGIDALCYPGVKSLQGLNYALHPRVADQLDLLRAFRCCPKDRRLEIEYVGEVEDGTIRWRKPKEEDTAWATDLGVPWRLDETYKPGERPDSQP